MKFETIAVCALGCLLVAGCDRLERVVGLGHRAQEETKREQERQFQENRAEERKASLQAERDSLTALIGGKLAVLSNRVVATEAAIRTLQADRVAFSKELGATTGGKGATSGDGLERALASPVINEIAMRYLKMDFSVARGEYAEAIAKARESEAEYKSAVRNLDETFDALVDPNPQKAPAARRAKTIASLERELKKLEIRRTRLARETIPTGNVYNNRRTEHDQDVRNVDGRIREIERMIDRLRTGDANERENADRTARFTREKALLERNRAVEKLKREHAAQPTVLKTIETYNEKTLRRLEQALVKESADLDERVRKSSEDYLSLRGMAGSVPQLSAEAVRKLQKQVQSL